jgi:hypothetical protein
MTIQINVSQKELNHKLQVCRKLASLRCLQVNQFNFVKYLEKFTYLQNEINACGNFEEIYQDLQQIEIELLEQI